MNRPIVYDLIINIFCIDLDFLSYTEKFLCTFCQTEVEEDESAVPKKDARTLVARFNEQIEPIYVLLRETEDINLSHELLEPEPSEIPALKQRWASFAQSGQYTLCLCRGTVVVTYLLTFFI